MNSLNLPTSLTSLTPLTSLSLYLLLIGLVAAERLAELVTARRHTAWSLARGGRHGAAASTAAATTRPWSPCTSRCWGAAWWNP